MPTPAARYHQDATVDVASSGALKRRSPADNLGERLSKHAHSYGIEADDLGGQE